MQQKNRTWYISVCYLGKRIKGKRTQNQWSQTKQCQDQNFDNKTSASPKAFKGKKILGTIEILKYNLMSL